MGMLKGNYALEDEVQDAQEKADDDKPLEQKYYRAALQKLGGSIAFVMKDKTFLWTGDDAPPSAEAGDKDESDEPTLAEDTLSSTEFNRGE